MVMIRLMFDLVGSGGNVVLLVMFALLLCYVRAPSCPVLLLACVMRVRVLTCLLACWRVSDWVLRSAL